MAERYIWWWRKYKNSLMNIVSMLIIICIYQIVNFLVIWSDKSNLAQIKGTLQDADIKITNYVDSSNHLNKMKKYELIFHITGRQQKFYIGMDKSAELRNEKIEEILKGLNQAKTVTVWVDKSEINKYDPEVLQIDNELKTLLDFETAGAGYKTQLILVLGVITIILVFRIVFPEKFKKMFIVN
jgi:hypothetical protein